MKKPCTPGLIAGSVSHGIAWACKKGIYTEWVIDFYDGSLDTFVRKDIAGWDNYMWDEGTLQLPEEFVK